MANYVTYQEFLKGADALSLEDAEKIYQAIIGCDLKHDREFERLFTVLQERAVIYVGYRAKWLNISLQERMEIDETRTRNHDLFIKAKNDLVKYMYEHKANVDWDDVLGENRKRIGDFACYMVFLMSLNAR